MMIAKVEEKVVRAYDLAALKYWVPSTHIKNFSLGHVFIHLWSNWCAKSLGSLKTTPHYKEVAEFRESLMNGGSMKFCADQSNVITGESYGIDSENLAKNIAGVNNYRGSFLLNRGPVWLCRNYINFDPKDWYYKGCKKCPKKVNIEEGKQYTCGSCGMEAILQTISI